jgi:integrase
MNAEKLLLKIQNTHYLKAKTKEEYIKRIKDYASYVKKDVIFCLENPRWLIDSLLKYIKDKGFSYHTADKIASCFMALFNYNQELKEERKDLFDSWVVELKRIKNQIDKKYESNAPTKRQEKGFVNFEEIIRVRDMLKAGSQERLLLFMYTEIPPVRNDYYKMRIYKNKPKYDVNNYLVNNNDEMFIILNDYKTDKTYKQIKINIPKILKLEIECSLKHIKRDYLFTSVRDNKPYTSDNSFNRFANRTLKAIFKNDMSLTTLRHIYISRRDLKLEDKSGTERREISNIMGHSLEQQQRYLWHTWLEKNEKKE